MEYLTHHFPIILHAAAPAGLDSELRGKLNEFLPLYTNILKEIIIENGKNYKDYRFFKPHHLAVISLPETIIFALDTTNAVTFLSAFFCFKLEKQDYRQVIPSILANTFNLYDCYYFEFDKKLFENSTPDREVLIRQKVREYWELETELLNKEAGILNISPKVFTNKNFTVKENYCFVLMPFEESLKEIYEESIKQAVVKAGMICERADDIFHNNSIMEVIWTKICSAEIIIADLTGRNPNVFYEVGIAHTLGKEVILLTQSEDDVPFDLRHIKYIKYTMTAWGQKALTNELELTIKSIKGTLENVNTHTN